MHFRHRTLKIVAVCCLAGTTTLVIYLGNLLNSIETIEQQLSFQYQQPKLPLAERKAEQINVSYVPVYSHIYADGGKPILLESTLSLRNTDPNQPILIHAVDYYNTQGELLKRCLAKGATLNALTSVEYLAEKSDISGGAGANFLITWSNPKMHPSQFLKP